MIATARLWRGARKLVAGVPLGGERVWPGVSTDLFVAHLSIYRFFARRAAGIRVLDAGCGLGYGSALIAGAGARSVLGIDIDRRAIAYARRRYGAPGLRFEIADCEHLELLPGSFDLIVSSNTLEHLRAPERFVAAARDGLAAAGAMIIAVPPNDAPRLRADNAKNPHHHSNLDVAGWCRCFAHAGLDVRTYCHRHPEMAALDFASSAPSRFAAESFEIEAVAPAALRDSLTLTAIFELRPR